ncbi:MAG: glycosyltransferase family 2 protein [Flavisolibacter sp.]|nr:glycosyltransferase family 2 protein [Flavisolibacter sp.]
MAKISIIIPCYYNEENIPVTAKELIENERLFPEEVTFEYVLVDDGSKDNTLQEIINFKRTYPEKVIVLKLAGNVGSYNAVVAGMEYATGDCTVVIAADLQDPPELMTDMYRYWKQGFKLVIGNRKDRQESPAQKFFSNTFHKIMKAIAIKNIPEGGFDYVLFDRQIRENIVQMKERNTNVFYLMTWMGYDYVNIPYSRKKREIGVSRWTLQKKVKLLIDSVLSFSFFPIRAISVIGIILGLVAFLYGIYIIILRIIGMNKEVQGWTALMVVLLFVSSFQMIGLGILGEYIWRGLDATRKRPLYVIEKVIQ